MNPTLLRLTALLAISTITAASAATLPAVNTEAGTIQVGAEQTPKLTSIGSDLLWLDGDQNLTMTVSTPGQVEINVVSPALDPSDYRSPNEYGDEQYNKLGTVTTYILSREDGTPITTQSFKPEDAASVPTALLYSGTLPAGTYHLKVSTLGKSKNTFGLQVKGAKLSAEQVNVTVLSHQFTTIAQFLPSKEDATIDIYDTDGPKELELRLVGAGGKITPVDSGANADRDSVTITVPASSTGTLLQARQPEKAYQHSNTIGIKAPKPLEVTALPVEPEVATPEATAEVDVEPAPEPIIIDTLTAEVTWETPTPPAPKPVPVNTEVTQILARESVITIHLKTNARGTVVVEQLIPANGTFDPQSVKIDGQAVTNTNTLLLGRNGELFFTVPASTQTISYRVSHDQALSVLDHPKIARLSGAGLEQINGTVNAADYAAATPAVTTQDAERKEGLIRFPLDESVVTSQTRLEVQYTGATFPVVKVNGVEIDQSKIGKKLINNDGSGGRLSYYAVQLVPGENVIEAGNDRITVKVPETASQLLITPVDLKGDGQTESRVKVTVQDKNGLTVPVPSITLNIEGAQPATPDAQPSVAGYQLALNNGTGELRLRPQSGGIVRIQAWDLQGGGTFKLGNSANGIAVANGNVVIPLSSFSTNNPTDNMVLDGRFAAELPFGDGTLRAVGDSQGIQTLSEIQSPRQLITGDAGLTQQPLTARGKLAAEYDSPALTARYALNAAIMPLTESVAGTDGAQVTVRQGDFSLIGTFARTDDQMHERSIQSVSGIIQLESNITPGSEMVTLSGLKGGVASERTLSRGVDYTINYTTGTVVLSRAPANFDYELENASINVGYNLITDTPGQHNLWGVAGRYATGKFGLNKQGATGTEIIVGAMNDSVSTAYGVRAKYEQQGLAARGLALYDNGTLVQSEVKGKWDNTELAATLSTQSDNYQGPNKTMPGTLATVSARQQVSEHLTVKGQAIYNTQTSYDNLPVPVDAGITSQLSDKIYGEALAEYDQKPWKAGIGLGYGSVSGSSLVLEAGTTGRYGLTLRHLQNLSGHENLTTITGTAPLNDRFGLKAEDRVIWGEGGAQHLGTVGLTGKFGVSQYDLTYELPNYPGAQGRLTSTVQADLPVNNHFTVGTKFTTVLQPVLGGIASVDARYHDNNGLLTVGTDIGNDGTDRIDAWTVGIRTSAAYSKDNYTVSETGQSVFGSEAQRGHRYALGAAYRGDQLNVLGTVRYEQGALAITPGYTGQLDTNYAVKDTELKAGFGVQTFAFKDYAWNAYAGATQWVTNRFGLGARYGVSGAAGVTAQTVGVEGTFVPLPGFGVSLGYNYAPGTGEWTPANLRQGLYVRADALLRK